LILELWGCRNLDCDEVEQAIREAVAVCQVNLIDMKMYRYSPQGVTGFAVLSESHITVHTWPEFGYAAVDVFTCGPERDLGVVIPVLQKYFQAERVQAMEVSRGIAAD
jgi:S-adenosylmethionine decarboxylase